MGSPKRHVHSMALDLMVDVVEALLELLGGRDRERAPAHHVAHRGDTGIRLEGWPGQVRQSADVVTHQATLHVHRRGAGRRYTAGHVACTRIEAGREYTGVQGCARGGAMLHGR